MTRTSGLVFCVVAAAVAGAHAFLTPAGRADDPKMKPPPGDTARPHFSHVITLPSSDDLESKLEAAPDYLRGGDWARGTQVIQAVLDHPEDAFVPARRAGGKAGVVWVSARAEANRLLATVPPRGLEVYEVQAGPKAAALLAAARKSGDRTQLARVAERYAHTAAGRQAADLLGTHALDRGLYETAARYFRRLLRGPAGARLEPLTLLKAGLAFHRCGDGAGADEAWKLLSERAPRGLVIGGQQVPLAELKKELARASAPAADPAAREWRVFRGAPGRAATSPAGLAGLRRGWAEPTVGSGPAAEWVSTALTRCKDRGHVALPTSFPLLVGGKLVYRDRQGARAVDPATGALHWEAPLSGCFKELEEDPANLAHVGAWASTLLQNFPHVLVENSTVGTLSADAQRVYAVEDLAVLPVARDHSAFVNNAGKGLSLTHAEHLTDAVYHSRLTAIELETGRLLWEVGGRGGSNEQPLHEAYFLGPPLPLGGKLYALVEKRQTLRLVCLDPASGRLEWAQTLAVPRQNLLTDGARRTWAAHPAYAEGVLVCPTNAGAVIAVDLAGRGLLWAHSYRDAPPPQPQPMVPPGARVRFRRGIMAQAQVPLDLSVKWKQTAPVLARGKVLIAAPDGTHLDCLDLRTGELLWQVPRRDEDLYVAGVYKDCALLVSRNRFWAVRLDSGVIPWSMDTGEPSGLGVLAGGTYYLPVRSCPKAGGPALYAIDLEKRAVVSRTALAGGDELGNLLLAAGQLVSQTATRIAAYPCGDGKQDGAE